MEEIQSANSNKAIVGATSDEPQKLAESNENSKETEELPMIVWLKGDEPYADDFSMDADAAMDALNIKRSRLTQISGKELRVGRIRIDRYTRPVYRPEDIAQYKEWTRPTATHLRSSSVISDAAKKLEEHTEQITQELKHGLEEQVAQLNDAIEIVRTENKEHVGEYLNQTRNLCEDIKLRFFEQSSRNGEELRQRVDGLTLRFDQTKEYLESLSKSLAGFERLQESQGGQDRQLQIITKALAQLTEFLAGYIEQQTNSNRDMGKALSLLIQFVRDNSRKQEQILAALGQEPIVTEVKTAKRKLPRVRARRIQFGQR